MQAVSFHGDSMSSRWRPGTNLAPQGRRVAVRMPSAPRWEPAPVKYGQMRSLGQASQGLGLNDIISIAFHVSAVALGVYVLSRPAGEIKWEGWKWVAGGAVTVGGFLALSDAVRIGQGIQGKSVA